jgi:hypothetical protein
MDRLDFLKKKLIIKDQYTKQKLMIIIKKVILFIKEIRK